jgi:hypothetical protein
LAKFAALAHTCSLVRLIYSILLYHKELVKPYLPIPAHAISHYFTKIDVIFDNIFYVLHNVIQITVTAALFCAEFIPSMKNTSNNRSQKIPVPRPKKEPPAAVWAAPIRGK